MATKTQLIALLVSCLFISMYIQQSSAQQQKTNGLRWGKKSVDSMEQPDEEKAADELRRFKNYFKRKYNQGRLCDII